MPDHFYTTSASGESAGIAGYGLEGTTGYVYTSQQPETIPIYRWYNGSNGDHFYCQDSNGELAPQVGYHAEGIAWYMFANEMPGTVALYRWYGNNDHFYTLDPSGEMASLVGYKKESVLGYLWPSPQSNAVPLYRWFPNQNIAYELNGYILKAKVWCAQTNSMRTSELDLAHCLKTDTQGLTGQGLYPVEVKKNLDDLGEHLKTELNLQKTGHNEKLALTLRHNNLVHMEWVIRSQIFADKVFEADFDIGPHLRRAPDGHIEFMHKTYGGFWHTLIDIAKIIGPALKTKDDPYEDAIEALRDYINHQDDVQPDVKVFLKDTYMDDGRLIRRGT